MERISVWLGQPTLEGRNLNSLRTSTLGRNDLVLVLSATLQILGDSAILYAPGESIKEAGEARSEAAG
jgi:hypothetical protein